MENQRIPSGISETAEIASVGEVAPRRSRDRWFLAYWIVLIQGLASAVPWNVFITETEYFNLRARQPPFLPIMAYNFEGINLLTSMLGQMLGFLIYIPLHHRMPLDTQVLWPQALTLGFMIASIGLTLEQGLSGNAFMTAILTFQAFMGVMNAIITGGVYELTSWLPAVYLQGMSLGIGLAGTAVSIVSFVTLAAVPRTAGTPSPAEIAPAALAYFTGSAAIVALSLVTYVIYFRLPYVHSHSIPEGRTPEYFGEERDAPAERGLSLPEGHEAHCSVDMNVPQFSRSEEQGVVHMSVEAPVETHTGIGTAAFQEAADIVDLGTAHVNTHAPVIVVPLARPTLDRSMEPPLRMRELSLCLEGNKRPDFSGHESGIDASADKSGEAEISFGEVVRRLWVPNFVVGFGCLVMMVTFPSLTSAICSERNEAVAAPCRPTTSSGRLFGDLFVPSMFLLSNGSDLVGRLVAGAGSWSSTPPSDFILLTYSFLRVPLTATLFFCKVITPRPWRLPILLRSDVWPVGIACLLGFSNGHLQSLALMHAPAALPKSARYRVGPIVTFSLAFGATIGSLISFLLIYFFQS